MPDIIFQNKKIFYRIEGKGNPVMLLHGFAETNNVWEYQTDQLKKKFLVIIPDIPGSGASDLLEGDGSIDEYAEFVKAIADAEGFTANSRRFSMIGHSMGGYITLAFTEKYPELLNSIGLFHSSAYSDDEAKKETRRKGIEFIKNNGAAAFLKTTSPNLFSQETRKENPVLVDDLLSLSKNFSEAPLIQYYNAMMRRPDRSHILKSFEKPVLFIIGKDDRAVPLQVSLEQCHLPAISFVQVLQHSGHMGMWEEKDRSNQFLEDFLERLH